MFLGGSKISTDIEDSDTLGFFFLGGGGGGGGGGVKEQNEGHTFVRETSVFFLLFGGDRIIPRI